VRGYGPRVDHHRSTPLELATTAAAHPLVGERTTAAQTAFDRLYGRGFRAAKRRKVIREEARLRSARASAALEGASVPLEQTRGAEVSDPIVQAALRLGPEYGRFVADWRAAPDLILTQLHTLVAATGEQVDPASIGRIRTDREAGDPFDIGPPPAPDTAAARLRDLEHLVRSEPPGHPVLVAAVVHGELLVLRPYGWGDGLIARAAGRLTLADRGLDPEFLALPEEEHLRLRTECAAALRAYAGGTPDGVVAWVTHCAAALAVGAETASTLAER
jgi:hypothetical protein